MTTIAEPSGPCAVRFWHWLGFFDHHKVRRALARHPFGPAGSRRYSRCCSIELPIAHQGFDREALTGEQKGSSWRPAISQQTPCLRQERPQVFQMRNGDLHCLQNGDAILPGQASPVAATPEQKYRARELPPHAPGTPGMGQVRDGDHATTRSGLRLRLRDAGACSADSDRPVVLGQQCPGPDLTSAVMLNLSIFQPFRDAGPYLSQRLFGQRPDRACAREGVGQLEKGVAALHHILPALLMRVRDGVQVHMYTAPQQVSWVSIVETSLH